MIAKTYTCSLPGIDTILVKVEVDLASGFPGCDGRAARQYRQGEQGQGQSGDPEQRISLPVRADSGKSCACGP
jgi:hypothetical protein